MTKPDDSPISESPLERAWMDTQIEGDEGGASHPGEKESADPELLRLPKAKRSGRHPLVSLAVIALSTYLLVSTRNEVAYYLSPASPQAFESPEALLEASSETRALNRFVSVEGAPDRKHAIVLESRFGGQNSFYRLQQAQNRLYVMARRQRGRGERNVAASHQGRLVAFDKLRHSAQLRDYFRKEITLSLDFDLSDLVRAKQSAIPVLTDKRGQKVPLDDNPLLWINVALPNEWIVQFSKKVYGKRDDARARLVPLNVPFSDDGEDSPTHWRFVTLVNEATAKRLIQELSDPSMHAGVIQRQVSLPVPWASLDPTATELVIKTSDPKFPLFFARSSENPAKVIGKRPVAPFTVPAKGLRYVSVAVPFEVPQSAFVLVADQEPPDYWYYLALAVVLAGFIVFNLWALMSRFRTRSSTVA